MTEESFLEIKREANLLAQNKLKSTLQEKPIDTINEEDKSDPEDHDGDTPGDEK